MADGSTIEWTEETWNPATGCDQISAGCDNCYALTLAKRLKAMGSAKYQTDGDPRTSGPGFGLTMHPDTLTDPLSWRKPRTVFVNSMSDLFHARVPREFVARVWETMATTPQHTYQVLTKRPERMARWVNGCARWDGYWTHNGKPSVAYGGDGIIVGYAEMTGGDGWVGRGDWPLRNVWLGTSVESDEHVGRADHLRRTPAAVRFVSAEPLLGPLSSLDLTGIDWLIVGGESGPNHRPVDPGWVRDLRDRCGDAGVAFFFKQWGGRTSKAGGRILDGRTWDEYPRTTIGARP